MLEKQNLPFRLVATDLDGTLRTEQYPFSPRLRNAVKQAQLLGVRFVIATGRTYRTSSVFAHDLGLSDAMVCDNGATVYRFPDGELLFKETIPAEMIKPIADCTPDHATLMICCGDHFYAPRVTQDALLFVERYREYFHELSGMDALPGLPQKILFILDAPLVRDLHLHLLAKFGDQAQIVQSSARYVEITHPQVSKGKGIAFLANRWNIPQSQVLAIGDQDNDRSMIEWAGMGVAMGNAAEDVRAMAKYIAPSVAEDGVAAVLEKYVLDVRPMTKDRDALPPSSVLRPRSYS